MRRVQFVQHTVLHLLHMQYILLVRLTLHHVLHARTSHACHEEHGCEEAQPEDVKPKQEVVEGGEEAVEKFEEPPHAAPQQGDRRATQCEQGCASRTGLVRAGAAMRAMEVWPCGLHSHGVMLAAQRARTTM